ncbi:MAG: cell division protein [Alphaproteobacteria bacterium]|nr:cell division protein [Alphaproteobacteria bacterium]
MFRRPSDLPFATDTSAWFLPWMVMLMVFFAGLTTAGTLSLNSMLSRWSRSISGSLTVQVIPIEEDGRINKKKTQQETQNVLDILRKTAGVASAEVLTDSQMKALLKPWLGESFLLEDLPMPHLIDVQLIPEAEVDLEMLRALLGRETPNASLDVHKLWLGKLIKLVRTLDFLASSLLSLVIATTSVIVIYVTCSSLAVHKPVIELLHQTGAHDAYISKQYAQRTALLAGIGALAGFSGVLPVIFMLSSVAREVQGGLLSEAKFDIASWGLLSLVPVLAVVLSTLTAYWTVQRTLRRML